MKTNSAQNDYHVRAGLVAGYAGPNDGQWGKRFLAALETHGLKLAPYRDGVYLGAHGPYLAPQPPENDAAYEYPCLMVEADDARDYTRDPEPRYEARGTPRLAASPDAQLWIPRPDTDPFRVVYVYRDELDRRITCVVAEVFPYRAEEARSAAQTMAQALAVRDGVEYIDRTRDAAPAQEAQPA